MTNEVFGLGGGQSAIANSAAPTFVNNDLVFLSTDLSGNLRVTLAASPVSGNVNLTEVGGVAIALGQTTMSASLPVTIASNQSNLNIIGTGVAGTPATGIITIQGITGGTSVNVVVGSPLPAGSNLIGSVNLAGQTSTGGTNYSVTISTSASQLTTQACNTGVQIATDSSNTGSVYVGFTAGVTAGGTPATNGFKLAAGASLQLPVTNANQVWLIGSAAGQLVYVLTL